MTSEKSGDSGLSWFPGSAWEPISSGLCPVSIWDLTYNGGGASRSCIPRRSLGTRSVARFLLDPEFWTDSSVPRNAGLPSDRAVRSLVAFLCLTESR